MIQIPLLSALLLYGARGSLPWLGRSLPAERHARVARGLLWGGVGLHAAGVLAAQLQAAEAGSLLRALAALSLLVMLGDLYLRRLPRMEALEGVLLPVSGGLLLMGLLAPGQAAGAAPVSWWLPVHIGFILLGFGGLAVAFSLSVLYLWVRRRLKEKKLEGIGRLPSLAVLDALNQRCMVLGFAALTVGAASGALWAAVGSGEAVASDATLYATAAVWLWYAVGLHLRLIVGYRGQTAAWFGVVGFAAISVLMLGASLLFQSFHGAG